MKKPIKILFADSDCACFNCVRLQKEWMGNQTGTEEEKHEKFRKEFCDYTELVFPEMAARVTRIVEKTGCKIIWSSTWRILSKYSNKDDAERMFNRRGLPGKALIGYTPFLGIDKTRGEEIAAAVKLFNFGGYTFNKDMEYEIVKAAVVDDDTFAGYSLPSCCRWFRTYDECGMTEAITDEIINYLGGD